MVSAKENNKKRGKERKASNNAPSTTANNNNGGAPTVGVVGAPRSRREAVPNTQVQEMISSVAANLPYDVLTPSPFSSITIPPLSTQSLNISTPKIVAKVRKGNKYVTESLAKSSIEGL